MINWHHSKESKLKISLAIKSLIKTNGGNRCLSNISPELKKKIVEANILDFLKRLNQENVRHIDDKQDIIDDDDNCYNTKCVTIFQYRQRLDIEPDKGLSK